MGGYFVTDNLRSQIASIAFLFCSLAIFGVQTASASELEFVGNASFPAKDLQRELQSKPEYYVCTHLSHDLKREAELVQDLVSRGYLASGFPDVIVRVEDVADNQDKLVVHVDEGRRFYNGPLRITGVDEAVESQIRQRLTTKYPSDEAFPTFVNVNGTTNLLWQNAKGEPAKLDSPVWYAQRATNFHYKDRLLASIPKLIQELGYPNAKLQTSYVQTADHKTELHIDFSEIGKLRTAETIHVVGLFDQLRDDMLDYVHIKPGDEVNVARMQEIVRLLWECGRFSKHRVAWDKDRPDTLNIEVEVVSSVPWLNEPLNEKALIVLKCQQWIAGLTTRGDEARIQSKDRSVKAILSSKGLFLDVDSREADESENLHSKRLQLAVNEQGVIVDYSLQPDRVEFWLQQGEIEFTLTIESQSKSGYALPGGDEPSASIVGGKFVAGASGTISEGKTKRKKGREPVNISIAASPAGLLPIAYRSDVECNIVGPNLEVTSDQTHIVVEAETGRVVSYQDGTVDVEFGQQLLSDEIAHLPVKKNRNDPADPIASLIKLCCDQEICDFLQGLDPNLEEEAATRRNIQTAIMKVAESTAFKRVSSVLYQQVLLNSFDGHFSIPAHKNLTASNSLYRELASYALKFSNSFEQNVWPAQIAAAEAMLLYGNEKELTEIIEHVLNDPTNGPVSYAALASCLLYHANPRTNEVASHGLNMLKDAHTQNDWKVLSDLIPREIVDDFFATIRSFTRDELDAVTYCLESPAAKRFLEDVYQSDPSKPANLGDALYKAQGQFLHDVLEQAAKAKVDKSSPESAFLDLKQILQFDFMPHSTAKLAHAK